LEPEGEDTIEYYLNGFSSSLPLQSQVDALKFVPGLEEAKIFRPGYAIEYNYFDPTQLDHTLETKLVKNLFFAGQINGTTGYEEAAAQGLIAGINAHLNIVDAEDFKLGRNESYIGVLIDDLVTKGVDEPYRMFTSRAEYRILLRQDDADERLTSKGFQLGLATFERFSLLQRKVELRDKLLELLFEESLNPEDVNEILEAKETSLIKQKIKFSDIISRPQIKLEDLFLLNCKISDFIDSIDVFFRDEILESAEISIKYKGYIEREKQVADKLKRLENIRISGKFDYNSIHSLSTEARQKLSRINPETIGHASRIMGVSPSDINVLLVLLGR
jgi:tRNA uridine 5-carboxymethylaminomethyl modification enzyme